MPACLIVAIKEHTPLQTELQLLECFVTTALQSYSLGCLHIDHLLVLTKANIYCLVADSICYILSPFNIYTPATAIQSILIILQSLHPTSYQHSIPHHLWLDFFLYPKVRYNLLSRQGWHKPHDPSNWEVTEGFIKKWGWVIQGGPDILRSTNKWRAKRGESPIFRYL
ncbi:hypothetical protein BDW71DRAFT_197418 [Aspergillus fruticulosus]